MSTFLSFAAAHPYLHLRDSGNTRCLECWSFRNIHKSRHNANPKRRARCP